MYREKIFDSFTLEKTGGFSETLVTIYQTIRCHNPEDLNLDLHHSEKPQIAFVVSPDREIGMTVMQAEADLRNAKPRYVVKPVNPRLTATEWRNLVAQDVLVSEEDLGINNGSEPQPGNERYSVFSSRS
jgi:hypothetical protein